MISAKEKLERRKKRTTYALKKKLNGRPLMYVQRSGKHIHVQVITDGKTLAAASTMDKDLRSKLKTTSDIKAAVEVGKLAAERALKAGIKEVVFNRGGYRYHGRVKAVADSAREAGLKL